MKTCEWQQQRLQSISANEKPATKPSLPEQKFNTLKKARRVYGIFYSLETNH